MKRTLVLLVLLIFILSLPTCGRQYYNTGKIISEQKETVEEKETQNQDADEPSITTYTEQGTGLLYNPCIYQTLVKPYTVLDNMSNIENISDFQKLTDKQKELLINNNFFVSSTPFDQFFKLYQYNSTRNIPSFITTDSIMYLFHLLTDYCRQVTEREKLVTVLEELTQSFLNKSISQYHIVKNPELKSCIIRNIAFFAAALISLGRDLPLYIPQEAKTLALEEYQLILNGYGLKKSGVFQTVIDYGIFKPEGHYNDNSDYRRYFRTLTLYSSIPFALSEGEKNITQTLQALLITYSMVSDKNEEDIKNIGKLYGAVSLFSGKPQNFSFYDYANLFKKVYGENVSIEDVSDTGKMDIFCIEAEKLASSAEKDEYISFTKEFTILGHGRIPDTEIFNALANPVNYPKIRGLDIMSVIGSEKAYEIQIADNTWSSYAHTIDSLKDNFLKIQDSIWKSDLNYGLFWTLKSFTKVYDSGYPSFMTSQAWQNKSLCTALSAWSELRHDTSLDGIFTGMIPEPKNTTFTLGYVEPSVEVYEKLSFLAGYVSQYLAEKGLITSEVKNILTAFNELVNFLIDCSVKELKNEKLSDDEYKKIKSAGDILECFASGFFKDNPNQLEDSKAGQNGNGESISAISAVVCNNTYLQTGIGPVYEIYVVVPIEGKLYLTRGGVFSYYEFTNTSGSNFSEIEWQKMIEENKQPDQPSWTESYRGEP